MNARACRVTDTNTSLHQYPFESANCKWIYACCIAPQFNIKDILLKNEKLYKCKTKRRRDKRWYEVERIDMRWDQMSRTTDINNTKGTLMRLHRIIKRWNCTPHTHTHSHTHTLDSHITTISNAYKCVRHCELINDDKEMNWNTIFVYHFNRYLNAFAFFTVCA